MANKHTGERIDGLIFSGEWAEARKLITRELEKDPDNHWLLARLGETFYEERQYRNALEHLLASKKIVPDCPLTLWHLAGTLDALGYHAGAVNVYTWILESKKTPKDDPCWEGQAWTDDLKTDCVFRLGICFEHLNRRKAAEHCFRQYVSLAATGTRGSYPIDDAVDHIKDLHKPTRKERVQQIQDVLRSLGKARKSKNGPVLDERKIKELQQA